MKIKLAASIVITALMLGAVPAAVAGGGGGFAGATEMTQIMNNAELAMQSVQEEMQSLELVEQTYLHRMQQYSSSIGQYTAPFAKAYGTYQKIKATQDKLTGLKGDVENLQGSLQNRFTQYATSKLSWQDWVAREGQMIKDGNERAKSQIESNQRVLVQTQESMQAYQSAADAMESTTGTHQATRLLGSQLTLLGGDINKLITITAETNRNQGIAMQDQMIEKHEKAVQKEAVKRSFEQSREETRAYYKALIKRGSAAGTQ